VLNSSSVFVACTAELEDPVGRLVGFAASQWGVRRIDPPPPSAPASIEPTGADGQTFAVQSITYAVLDPRTHRHVEPERVLATLLFTDIVGSTLRAERMGVAGIAIHVAARIVALAGPNEILVSQTVRDLAAGSGSISRRAGSRSSEASKANTTCSQCRTDTGVLKLRLFSHRACAAKNCPLACEASKGPAGQM
jgi:hypothetical protein